MDGQLAEELAGDAPFLPEGKETPAPPRPSTEKLPGAVSWRKGMPISTPTFRV
jgi:hypothetical protein